MAFARSKCVNNSAKTPSVKPSTLTKSSNTSQGKRDTKSKLLDHGPPRTMDSMNEEWMKVEEAYGDYLTAQFVLLSTEEKLMQTRKESNKEASSLHYFLIEYLVYFMLLKCLHH